MAKAEATEQSEYDPIDAPLAICCHLDDYYSYDSVNGVVVDSNYFAGVAESRCSPVPANVPSFD